MLSVEALQAILGIHQKVYLTPAEMADQMNITFFPYLESDVSQNVLRFKKRLLAALERLRVNIVPYEEAFETVSFRRIALRFLKIIFNNLLFGISTFANLRSHRHFIHLSSLRNVLRRRRIKRGISVIALGEQKTGNLPMDHTSSFTQSSVITILDWPEGITEDSKFHAHFDTALRLFAYHMTNIVIAVDDEKWLLYNFNASHPIYRHDRDDFDQIILKALVPKIVAPIRPVKFGEFEVRQEVLNIDDANCRSYVDDLVESGPLFENTGLYPAGRMIDTLPFRNEFYRWIGKIHLDQRNGMSFGFLARQLPVRIPEIIPIAEAKRRFVGYYRDDKDYFEAEGKLFIIVEVRVGEKLCLPVPEVWVLSQRSGSDKTHIVPGMDLVKLGLSHGRLLLETPRGLRLNSGYRPSFDTRVILAHAAGNAIIASVLSYYESTSLFSNQAQKAGFAIAHWHGYFHPNHLPNGFYSHGESNPHVSCSSPQSAIFAIAGKLRLFLNLFRSGKEFCGDVHVEPHHGLNITFSSLLALGKFLVENPDATRLGSEYLSLYNDS